MAKITPHPAAQTGGLTQPARLISAHNVSHFSSGQPILDDWLKKRSLESENVGTARTYVVCEQTLNVVGYYSIAMGSVQVNELPPKLKRKQGLPKQIPVAILARLARDEKYRGQGLGADLLQDALKRILQVSQMIGVRAVLVHAIDDKAATFWRDNEFVECPVDSRSFYLPIETIAGAL
ncbi:MAG TPA: GNAT family N-acetyltransferase [Pseudolabrys sp.]|nr:GNAT family N-acetyltransferase [Pseudolabrys sp.]